MEQPTHVPPIDARDLAQRIGNALLDILTKADRPLDAIHIEVYQDGYGIEVRGEDHSFLKVADGAATFTIMHDLEWLAEHINDVMEWDG